MDVAWAPLPAALGCPRCAGGPLRSLEGGDLECGRCGGRYPLVGTIPCLLEDPSLWRSLWISRLNEYIAATESPLQTWRADARRADLLPRTRERLTLNVSGLEEQRRNVSELLRDLAPGFAGSVPTRPEPGDKAAVLLCYEHLFRDWAWGARECEAMLSIVTRLAPHPLGNFAVLGAGACRLAVDVHRALSPRETVALDENPLPLLVAARLLRGETVTLPECPVAPHAVDRVWIRRDLSCPWPVPPGFSLVFADALRPPIAPGSLDAVLTPWFVDVVRADFREIPPIINRLLRSGGTWINVGPLRFKRPVASSYAIEEVWDLVAQSGFELLAREREDIPYFDSPDSGSRRQETVFCFAARKTGEASPVTIDDSAPPWIGDTRAPVPQTPELMRLGRTSWFTAGVIALVDGNRSLSDIAHQMAGTLGLDPANVLDQLRAFFAKIPRD